MASPRVTRRAAMASRVGKPLGNNVPLVDLTNRGGAASASARRGKENRPTKATGEGSKRRREGDVDAVATSGSAKVAKKAKKDDFKCAETMPSGRAVPNVERGLVAANSLDYPFSVRGGRRAMELVKENVLTPYVTDGRYFKCV